MQLRDKTINLPKNEKALKIKSEIKASRKGLKGREIIFTLHALVQRGNWGLEGFLVGEGTISYATWWEQSKDIKLPGEPRFVLPYNLFVHIVHFIQANSTILRQNVSWGHWVGSKLHREGCQKWGARRGSEEIRWYRGWWLGAKIWQFSERILHIPHKFFDCHGKYLPEHSDIIYPSINSISNFLGIGPKRIHYIGTLRNRRAVSFSPFQSMAK